MNFTFEKPDWMVDAACRDLPTEWFFPGRGGNTALPKQVCARCPVRKECLDYSMTVVYGREAEDGPGGSFGTSEKYGIWGGHSERERRDMRRGRKGNMSLPAFAIVTWVGVSLLLFPLLLALFHGGKDRR